MPFFQIHERCYCEKQAYWADLWPRPFYIRPLSPFHIASNLIIETIEYICSCHSIDKAIFSGPLKSLFALMIPSKKFFFYAGLKRCLIQNWTDNTSVLYPPGLFLLNLQNFDLRFNSSTGGGTDRTAQDAELRFINVVFADLHIHFTFGSICLRISQTMLSDCRYRNNQLSKTGKSCDNGVWTWSGNVLQQASML